MNVLVRVAIAVNRHQDHGNSYKEKYLIGAGFQFQRFSPLSPWWEAWQHAGRHGARERAESSMSCSKQEETETCISLCGPFLFKQPQGPSFQNL